MWMVVTEHRRKYMSQRLGGTNLRALLIVLTSVLAFGQTRTEQLERERSEHQKELAPEKNSRIEEILRRLRDEKVLERINYGYNGISAKVGGLVTGGGFAFGPQYFRGDLKDGALVVR